MADPRKVLPLLYHFCRLRLPGVNLPLAFFSEKLSHVFDRWPGLSPLPEPDHGTRPKTWSAFLDNLHAQDFFLACACLKGERTAWEHLFGTRLLRGEGLLVDALRSRAARLYPRNEERQEEAVAEFWGYLLAGERTGSDPILARYDGLRPLVPWLLRVFQNKELSSLRKDRGPSPLNNPETPDVHHDADDDVTGRWNHAFCLVAQDWLSQLNEEELLLLGLRLRYNLSQREVARLMGVHEGNITRKMDALSRRCHEVVGRTLGEMGWTGDDLFGLMAKEMPELLRQDHRLGVDSLAALLSARNARCAPRAPNDSRKS